MLAVYQFSKTESMGKCMVNVFCKCVLQQQIQQHQMPLATAIATKKKEVLTSPHIQTLYLHHFNIICNYVDKIVIMYF